MILLALIGVTFVAIAVAVGVDVWQVNARHVPVEAFNHSFSQPAWATLGVGAGCGALVVIGLGMILVGGARARRQDRELASVRRDPPVARGRDERTIDAEEQTEQGQPARITGMVESDTVSRRARGGAHFAGRRSVR